MPNDSLVVTKNARYWQRDRSGNALPYLDEITFRPEEDTSQRVNGLKGGDLDLIHVTDGKQIAGLRNDARAGLVKLLESQRDAEVDHTMLNAGKPPFDHRSCRLAVAYSIDTQALSELTGAGRRLRPSRSHPRRPDTNETLGIRVTNQMMPSSTSTNARMSSVSTSCDSRWIGRLTRPCKRSQTR